MNIPKVGLDTKAEVAGGMMGSPEVTVEPE